MILQIQMTVAGLDLVISALRKLPHEQVDTLVQELLTQGRAEIARQTPAETAPADQEEEQTQVG